MNVDPEVFSWDILKVKLKNIYPQLTGADLMWRHSSIEELIDNIANKLRITKRQLSEAIKKNDLK